MDLAVGFYYYLLKVAHIFRHPIQRMNSNELWTRFTPFYNVYVLTDLNGCKVMSYRRLRKKSSFGFWLSCRCGVVSRAVTLEMTLKKIPPWIRVRFSINIVHYHLLVVYKQLPYSDNVPMYVCTQILCM
jgi:hypothetical protein